MATEKKKLLGAEDFEKGKWRDISAAQCTIDIYSPEETRPWDEQKDFLVTFAPINIVTSGGFLAVTHFKSRTATADLDYMIELQWAQDEEIKTPFKEEINYVAEDEIFEEDWMNDELEI